MDSLRRESNRDGKYGFVEEGRFCGCTSLLGQEFVIKMYYAGKRASRGPL
jgi:hypothetical protein